MPHAFILRFPDGTLDQYDQVIERMGLTDGKAPDGALFHWVTKTDEGLMVVDVWESPEVFEKFAQEQIGPHTAAVGISEPTIEAHEVHNVIRE